MSAVLLLALNVFRQSRWEFLAALGFALPALAGRWLLQFTRTKVLILLVSACWMILLGFTVVIILRHILTTRRVTYDTISGAVCGYLLFGVMYAFAFVIIDYFYPGSFSISLKSPGAHPYVYVKQEFQHYVYFSFVTLASLGYGDIAPLSAPARACAAMEGIAGQFYIAVLIARLVSLHSSRWGNE
jgi:Ion channel